METGNRLTALSIAGFDPSSGAGFTADLKVFAAHGIYGLAAPTALTVQSTQGVRRVVATTPSFLAETLDYLAEDVEIAGIKIGMLGSAGVAGVVSAFLARVGIRRERVVLDPVLRSSSGRALLDAEGAAVLKSELLHGVGWVTPNLEELAELAELEAGGREAVRAAAAVLTERYAGLNVVATGGHLDPPDDFLRTAEGVEEWFPGVRIKTAATHGTGCAFSSALLAALIEGKPASAAVAQAKAYVRSAMKAAYKVGKGKGPLNHFYEFEGR